MGSITQPNSIIIGASITNATAGSILFAGALGVLAQDNANLFWDATNKRLGIGTNAPGAKLTIAAGTATTAVSPLAITQTWNNAAITFPGVTLAITDTASAAGSIAWQVLGGAGGATNLLALDKAGNLKLFGTGATIGQFLNSGSLGNPAFANAASVGQGFYFPSTAVMTYVGGTSNPIIGFKTTGLNSAAGTVYGWSSTSDVTLAPDAALSRLGAASLAIGNGTNGDFSGTLKTTTINAVTAFQANGTPGVAAFGPAAVVSITVQNGIITAIS